MTKIQNAEHMFSEVRVLRLARSSYTPDHTQVMYLNLVDMNFTVQEDWPEI